MAWKDLLTADYGLMSLGVLAIVIAIGVVMYRMPVRLMAQPPDGRG